MSASLFDGEIHGICRDHLLIHLKMNRNHFKGQSRTSIYRKIRKTVDSQLLSCIDDAITSTTAPTCPAQSSGDEFGNQAFGQFLGDEEVCGAKFNLVEGETSEGEFNSSTDNTSENELPSSQRNSSRGEVGLDQVGQGDKKSTFSTSEEGREASFDLASFLGNWSLRNNITLTATTELLKGLRVLHHDLPKDARTLLNTPRNVGVCQMGVGEYIFLGITEMILKYARHALNSLDLNLSLNFNVDGIPLFDASLTEFWPILCNIEGLDNIKPFAVAVYCGVGKPPIQEFFKDFILDLNNLLENGLTYNEINYRVNVRAFICDAPAKAFMRCVKLYSGYWGVTVAPLKAVIMVVLLFQKLMHPFGLMSHSHYFWIVTSIMVKLHWLS